MKLLVSAAEASSDLHGARLVRALREELKTRGEMLEVFGAGGPALQAEGLRPIVDARDLLAMGFTEVLGRLPRIFASLRALEMAARVERPELAIVIDYPDFHFRLARRLRRIGLPAVYFIPPKVWVWRSGRVERLKRDFLGVLSIFPFEREFFSARGLDVRYVGNPLLDGLPLQETREGARQKLGVSAETKLVALLPGSRPSELRRHTTLFLEGAVRAAALLRRQKWLGPEEALELRVTLPETASLEATEARISRWMTAGGWDRAGSIIRVRVSQGDSSLVLKAADAGLVKSGTSTLEAALLECPHAVVYRPGAVSAWVFKHLIRYRDPVGLVNLVLREAGKPTRVAPEILMEEATAERLGDELTRLLSVPSVANKQRAGFRAIRARLEEGLEGRSPSVNAARAILDWVKTRGSGKASS